LSQQPFLRFLADRKVKLKVSLYIPGEALGLQVAPRISRKSAHEGGKVVSPAHTLIYAGRFQ